MSGHLLTADGSAAASVQSLADLLDTHRNRIAEFRRAGAPEGLDLIQWMEWLQAHRRPVQANLLRQAVKAIGDEPAMPAVEPAAQEGDDDEGSDDDSGEGIGAWKEREARARALRSELALEEDRRAAAIASRDLLSSADVIRAIVGLSSAVNDILNLGIWTELKRELAGATPDLINRLRAAHLSAVSNQRQRVADAARSAISKIKESP